MADLIADCTDIPARLRDGGRQDLPSPRAAAWAVTDSCAAQVNELDEYV
jgi:hypothetical protein